MPQPVGSLHGETARRQVDIAPFERDDLPEPQSRITARQHHQVRARSALASDSQQSLVLIEVVKSHRLGAAAGINNLAPRDLRRNCARLCHLAGGELDQIQFLLGHVSIQTTERYLGCKQSFGAR